MKILSIAQIRECDAFTIENEPILSIDLMERAAQQLAHWFEKHFNLSDSITLFAGTGNNGGDALALARLLYNMGFTELIVYFLQISEKLSPDCETNFQRLKELYDVPIYILKNGDALPELDYNTTVVDGIFGSGLSRSIEGYWASLINHINVNASEIIAIDIPSGFFGDDNSKNTGATIKANVTLSFQFPKLAFLFAENYPFVGEWLTLDIGLHPKFIEETDSPYNYTDFNLVSGTLKPRGKFMHKGNFGHAFLVAKR